MGTSKRKSITTTGRSSVPVIRDNKAAGNEASSTAGTKRLRRLAQKRLVANVVVHHRRHRTNVRRVAPSSAASFAADFFDGPLRSALASTMTAPRYTFLPRNRTDGGVLR